MKEEKIRKKDDKSVEQVLKALNSLETTEEKLAAMCKKYTDIVDENRKLQVTSDVNDQLKFFCKKSVHCIILRVVSAYSHSLGVKKK